MAIPKIIEDIRNLQSKNQSQDSAIELLTNSQLVGKYYVPTSSIVESSSSTVTVNPLPTTWTGSGASYTSGGYAIESSGVSGGGSTNSVASAFDNNIANEYIISILQTSTEPTITITLPEALVVTQFSTYITFSTGSVDTIFIEGSNNKSNWSQLSSFSNPDSTSLSNRSFTNNTAYKYYRFRFTFEGTNTARVGVIQISRYSIKNYFNNLVSAEIPTMSMYQRVMIKTPNFSTTGVVSTTLNNINVDTLMLPNRYYELIYDGTKYLSKEVI